MRWAAAPILGTSDCVAPITATGTRMAGHRVSLHRDRCLPQGRASVGLTHTNPEDPIILAPAMTEIRSDLRVILIGGSSHVGKSTLSRSLADKLGWRLISTDKMARHPGRPWRSAPERLPDHVAEHSWTVPSSIMSG